MCPRRLHAGQAHIDRTLVRRLISEQFPQWSDLRLEEVKSGGTVNAIYRLGDDLCARLPLLEAFVPCVDRETRVLSAVARLVPLAIPVPVARGVAGDGYPWPWSIHRWLNGEPWATGHPPDLGRAASTMAAFVAVLHAIDTGALSDLADEDGLRGQDAGVRSAIAASADLIDAHAASDAWDAALAARGWDRPGVLVHGDLIPGNLLIADGAVTAVIDFGSAHVGDPARDLATAWTLLDPETRQAFRRALPYDDATWARARGWAIRRVVAIPYYLESNPDMVSGALYAIEQALAREATS